MGSISLLLMKASALLAVAIVFARMIRGSAGRRHSFWSGAFAALLLLPLLGAVLPSIEVSVPRSAAVVVPSAPGSPSIEHAGAAMTSPTSVIVIDPVTPRPAPRAWMPTLPQSLLALWITGVVIALGGIILSLARVARLEKRGYEVTDEAWRHAVDRIGREFGVGHVRLIADESVETPMAAGIRTPTIFLPADAAEWSDDRRDVVLAHEMAHLASRDPIRHLVSRVAVTLYWFHPLAWLAAREATTACEQACDEAVLSLGVRPSAYAEILLDFATGAPASAPAAALPIVRRRLLESRLMAILDTTPRRGGRVIVPAALGLILTLSIAAIRPGQEPVRPEQSPSGTASPAVSVASPEPASTPLIVASKPAAVSPSAAPSRASASIEACERNSWSGSYTGTISSSSSSGVEYSAVQRESSDLRVCMAGEEPARATSRPSEWLGSSRRLILVTEERGGDLRRMEIARGVTTYSVNGRPAPVTANVEEWRRALIAAMDATWEVNELQGRVNSLRGEINSIQGDRNSLQGEINSLQGEVNSMQGEINSIRGQENSLRGEINSINGELNSMRGEINSEQGAINSLQASRNDPLADRDAIDARIRRHQDNIRRIEDRIADYNADRRIKEVERRIRAYDPDGRVAEVERRIRDFDLEGKTAAVRRRIDELDVEGQTASIERRIRDLHEDERSADLQRRAEDAMQELRARLRR